LVGNWIGRAALSAKVRLRSNFFFSLFGIFFAAVTSSSSCWMAVGGFVNTFVCESIAAITKEILAATPSYSAKFLKPFFLVIALSSASYLALALPENTTPGIIFSTTADMSFWAAMNPSTSFSVRAAGTQVDALGLVGQLLDKWAPGGVPRFLSPDQNGRRFS